MKNSSKNCQQCTTLQQQIIFSAADFVDQCEQFKSKSYVSNLVQEKLMFQEEKTLMN